MHEDRRGGSVADTGELELCASRANTSEAAFCPGSRNGAAARPPRRSSAFRCVSAEGVPRGPAPAGSDRDRGRIEPVLVPQDSIAARVITWRIRTGWARRASRGCLPGLSCETRTGRRVAPSRLEVTDRAIEAVRARTSHEADGASEDARPPHGSASLRHVPHRQPVSGQRAPSRPGSGGAGASRAQRPRAGQPADELRLRTPLGREPV